MKYDKDIEITDENIDEILSQVNNVSEKLLNNVLDFRELLKEYKKELKENADIRNNK